MCGESRTHGLEGGKTPRGVYLSLLLQAYEKVIAEWKMTKFEVLEGLEKLDDPSAKRLAQLGQKFYEIAKQRERQRKDPEFCWAVIRVGYKAGQSHLN